MIDTDNYFKWIIAYEEGNTSEDEDLKLFSYLVKHGHAWRLQGHYGRTAMAYIEAGLLTKEGDIVEHE